MPTFRKRNPSEVPQPTHVSHAVQEQQRIYNNFIQEAGNEVGELELAADDKVRSVKVRLRRASTRLVIPIEIWDANGKVYFSRREPRRGRPRKAKA